MLNFPVNFHFLKYRKCEYKEEQNITPFLLSILHYVFHGWMVWLISPNFYNQYPKAQIKRFSFTQKVEIRDK